MRGLIKHYSVARQKNIKKNAEMPTAQPSGSTCSMRGFVKALFSSTTKQNGKKNGKKERKRKMRRCPLPSPLAAPAACEG
jgi:hypothetical protein